MNEISKMTYAKFMDDRIFKLRVAGFEPESVVDGPGVRFTIFLQGCLSNCPECHNPETHSLTGGELIPVNDIYNRIKSDRMIKRVTFSGGEPLLQPDALLTLAELLRNDGYNMWLFTGYTMEDVLKHNCYYRLLEQLDVVVDGGFVVGEKSMDIKYRGSKNQRIINVPETLATGRVTVIPDNEI